MDKEIGIEVREIVFSNEEERSFCDVFVYEPENIGEQALGNLYIIGEITNISENSSYLVNLLASIIKKEFYLNTKRTAIESLEASLHKANSTLSDIAEQGNIDWVGNLNMVCAVYSKNKLHLSQAGNCKTLLIRNGQITDIGKSVTKGEKTHPFRTFANIASGELEIDDLALFATPGFFNIFSLEKLRKLSSSFDFDEFVEKLQNSIGQEKDISTVGSLIMKIRSGEQEEDRLPHIEIEPVAEDIYKKEVTPVFHERLKETDEKIKEWTEEEAEKEKTSVDVDISEPKKIADSQISQKGKGVSLEDIIGKYEEVEEKDNNEAEKEMKKGEIGVETTGIIDEGQDEEKVQEEIKSVSLDDLIKEGDYSKEVAGEGKSKKGILSRSLKTLYSIFGSTRTRIMSVANYTKKTLKKTDDSISTETEMESSRRVKLIPVRSKHLLAIFVVIIAVLVWNIISTNHQKGENDKFEEYNSVLSQAENKINEVEGIVIYGDFEMARELLTSAKISALEVKNKYEKLGDEADILLKKIQVQFDRIDLVNRIDDPRVAIDLSQEDKLKNAGGIIKVDKEYYVFSLSDNNSLCQADFESGKAVCAQTENEDNIGQFKISTAMAKTGEIIFLTNSNKIAVFDISKKELDAKDIKFSNGVSGAKGMASYSSYLYLLEPDSNQIYKYTRSASGFGKGEEWIKDPKADIGNAVSLAIDGLVYVLKSDGSVDKYLRGSKFKADNNSDFSIDKLGDPISNPAEIYTRSDLNYLYIVEPQKNRIVLFDKINGKLIRQYISESFSDLKNIAVDDKEEKMYVLSGDKVFEIGIKE